jgi:pimeloyl-ACP methyl ester carboxylesterase
MEVGVAVVLPDKRGCEKSEGEWLGRDFFELATDTAAAGKWVRQQDLFAASGIGLIGMSQGGWIAPIVAADDPDLAFVVSMSGATVPVEESVEVLRSQGIAGKVEIYPRGGHAIADPESHRVHPAFLSDLTDFVVVSTVDRIEPLPHPVNGS